MSEFDELAVLSFADPDPETEVGFECSATATLLPLVEEVKPDLNELNQGTTGASFDNNNVLLTPMETEDTSPDHKSKSLRPTSRVRKRPSKFCESESFTGRSRSSSSRSQPRDTEWGEDGFSKICSNSSSNNMRCLLCLRAVSDDEDFPKRKGKPKEINESSLVIFVLKTLLGISTKELVEYLAASKGRSPNKWIILCGDCRSTVKEAEQINKQIIGLQQILLNYKEKCLAKLRKSCGDIIKRNGKKACLTCRSVNCKCDANVMVTNKVRRSVISRERTDSCSKTSTQASEEYLQNETETGYSSSLNRKSTNRKGTVATKLSLNPVKTNRPVVATSSSGTERSRHVFNESKTQLNAGVEDDTDNDNDVDPGEIDFGPSGFSDGGSDSDYENEKRTRNKKIKMTSARNVEKRWPSFSTKMILGGAFFCPMCPNLRSLGTMDIGQFVLHLVFHNYHPKQCTKCKVFLPDNPVKLNEHLARVHSPMLEESEEVLDISCFTTIDLHSFVKIHNCSKCEETFFSAEDRDDHAKTEHNLEITKNIKCRNCSERFASSLELRLHQALMHPIVAMQSCSVCFDVFPEKTDRDAVDKEALAEHFQNAHSDYHSPVIRQCSLCGFPFNCRRAELGKAASKGFGSKFHNRIHHPKILNLRLQCTLCKTEFKNVLDHQMHLKEVHSKKVDDRVLFSKEGSDVKFGEIIRTWPTLCIRCHLCHVKDENLEGRGRLIRGEMRLRTEGSMEQHLLEKHYMGLIESSEMAKIKSRCFVEIMGSSKMGQPKAKINEFENPCRQSKIEVMDEFEPSHDFDFDNCNGDESDQNFPDVADTDFEPEECEVMSEESSDEDGSKSEWEDTKDRKSKKSKSSEEVKSISFHERKPLGGSYRCPACPNLDSHGIMDISQFVGHLLFHSNLPYQCTQCKIFLPDYPEKLENHLEILHPSIASQVKEGGNLTDWFTKVSLNSIAKIYDCWKCKERFSTANERDCHSQEVHNIEIGKSFKCADCEEQFANLFELKLHQALAHPIKAVLSCPACQEMFPNPDAPDTLDKPALEFHILEAHPTLQVPAVRTCDWCGLPFAAARQGNGNARGHGRKLHNKIVHAELLCTRFKCVICKEEFTDVLNHQKHLLEAHSKKIDERILYPKDGCGSIKYAETIQTYPILTIHCSLCFLKDQNGRTVKRRKDLKFGSEERLELHLKKIHHLEITSKSEKEIRARDRKQWKRWYKSKQMLEDEFNSGNDLDEAPIIRPIKFGPKEKESKGRIYECQQCPNLDPMNLDAFIVHIIFHWRQPNQCTQCSYYLSNTQLLIDRHWRENHGDVTSKVKLEGQYKPANYTPGKVWICAIDDCRESFETDMDKNAHQREVHKQKFKLTEQCNVCSKQLKDVKDVRLHKALEHPEDAELCCPYCDESFGVISVEGLRFRNGRNVLDHLAKNHLRYDRGKHIRRFIMEACSFCGEVFERPQYLMNHLTDRHHIPSKKQYTCVICHRRMTQREIKRHTIDVHAPKPVCELCGVPVLPKVLKHHKFHYHGILEPDAKIKKCPVEGCNFETTRTSHLTMHKYRKHQPNKPKNHSCIYCGKAFKYRNHLKRHEQIHTNAETRPFACDECDSTFPVRNYLYTHKRVVHYRTWNYPSSKKRRRNT